MKAFLIWIGLIILSFPGVQAQNCIIDAGRDTLICGYSYTLVSNIPNGEWSVDCETSPGVVDFFRINDTLTSATVNQCGEYTFVHFILDRDSSIAIDTILIDSLPVLDTLIVYDTLCFAFDTTRVVFRNPGTATFDLVGTTTVEFLESDCIQNDTINCGNRVNNNNSGPPDPLWTFISVGICNSTIFTAEASDTAGCIADQISFTSVSTLGTVSDTFSIYQSEFMEQDPLTGEIISNNYGEVLNEVNNNIFESVAEECPLPEVCGITLPYCLDTVPDTTMLILPNRLSGYWQLFPEEDIAIILEDTTQFVKDDSTYILITEPSPSDYEATFDIFQINYLGDTVPASDIGSIDFQWIEEWGLDTIIEIGTKIIDTCCAAPIHVSREELNETQAPVYDCPPFSAIFLEDLNAAVHIPACDSGFYSIVINISGGRAPYEVLGLPGTMENGVFTSDLIPVDSSYNLLVQDRDGCSKALSGNACPCIDVETESIPQVGLFCGMPCTNLIGSATIDVGDSLVLSWGSYDGTFLGFGDSIQVCDTGIYVFQARDPVSGCISRSLTRVEEREIIADTGPDTLLNCYHPEIRLGGPDLSYGSDLIYSWSGPGIDSLNADVPLPLIDSPGIYELRVLLEGYNCGDSSMVVVSSNFSTPHADAGEDKGLTCDPDQTIGIGGLSSTGDSIQYIWSGPGINSSNRDQRRPAVLEPGIYQQRVIDLISGCSAEDEVEVFPYNPIQFTAVVLAPSCFNAPEGRIFFSDVSGGRPPYSYSWNGQFFTGANPQINIPAGMHLATVRDANGCEEKQEVIIEKIPDIELDLAEEFHYCTEGQVVIDATLDFESEQISYRWSNGSIQAMTTFIDEPGSHWVEITSPCETVVLEFEVIDDSDVEASISEHLIMPNAFSPDNDGHNDLFGPILGEIELVDYEFVVYNRWGQTVFRSNDTTLAWDGLTNEQEGSSDVYLWTLKAKTIICDGLEEEINYKGNVTLIR